RGPSPLHTPPAAPRLRPPLPVLLPCTGASCLLPSDSSHPAIPLRTVRNFTPRNGWSDGRQAQLAGVPPTVNDVLGGTGTKMANCPRVSLQSLAERSRRFSMLRQGEMQLVTASSLGK